MFRHAERGRGAEKKRGRGKEGSNLKVPLVLWNINEEESQRGGGGGRGSENKKDGGRT